MRSFFSFLVVLIAATTFSFSAQARVKTADEMTCAEAVTYYEKHNRIWVWASGDDIVPIYGMKPASKIQELRCPIKNSPRPYPVRTQDTDLCVIGYSCQSS